MTTKEKLEALKELVKIMGSHNVAVVPRRQAEDKANVIIDSLLAQVERKKE